MAFLLDTNVVSELRKASRCSRSVLRWYQDTPAEEMYTSVVVFGELRGGVEKLRLHDPEAAHLLEQWMHGLRFTFEDRILRVTLEICDQWGYFAGEHNLAVADGLLAATARCNNLTVATRNERHFQRVGVDYFNPFRGGKP
jgi:predicted nucleic acid-binding protein